MRLHHPYLLGVTIVGRNQYGYISPAVSGLRSGQKSIWLHHPCLLGVPIVGRNQYGYILPAFLGSPWWAKINMTTSPVPSRGGHSGEKSIWLHLACLLGVSIVGRSQYGYITRAFLGSP